jgi:uncharacterized protein (TIGR00106 family)
VVSRVFEVLDRSGLSYEMTVMGTVVEGTPEKLFALAAEIHAVMFSDAASRVVTVIRVDERTSRQETVRETTRFQPSE